MGKSKRKSEKDNVPVDWVLRIIALFLAGSIILPFLVLTDATMDPAYLVRHIILSVSVVVSAGLFFLLPKERGKVGNALWQSFKQPISIAFLMYIGAKVVSTFSAVNTVEAGCDIFSSIVCYLFFLMLVAVLKLREGAKKQLLWVVAIFNVIILLFGVFAFIKVAFDWEKMGEVGSQMVNPNLFAPLFFMVIPFLLVLLKQDKYKKILLVLIIADVAMMVALQNRATYLALLVGVVAYVGGYLLAQGRKVLAVAYFVLLGAGIVFGAYMFTQQENYWEVLTDRNASIHDNYNSVTERLQIWNRSMLLFRENPAVGVGAGNWPLRVGEYGITDPKSDHGSKYFLRPHNELLRVISELGVLGVITVALILLFIGIALYKLFASGDNKHLGLALLFGFVGSAAIASLSFPTERVPHMALMLGMVALLGTNKREGQEKENGFMLPIVLALSIAGAFVFYQRMQNDIVAKKMDNARNAKHWGKVMDNYKKIDVSRYNVNYFRVPIGFYSGLYYYHQKDLQAAKAEFSQALTCNPNHILTITNLATCYQQMNMPDSAIQYFERALQVNPNFETARLNLAITYYNSQGRALDAWETLLKCNKPPNNIRVAIVRNYLQSLLEAGQEEALQRKILTIQNEERWLLWVYSQTKEGLSLEEILREV